MLKKKPRGQMSNLKKKLLLYFIIIAVVSFSISAEMILEFSAPSFRNKMVSTFYEQLELTGNRHLIARLDASLDMNKIFEPMFELRERILLLMLFIAGSIIIAFSLFTSEIISPLEDIVRATRKMSQGDLTAVAPIRSNDEIGQIANMLNNTNENLIQLLIQLRYELSHQTQEMNEIVRDVYQATLEQQKKDYHSEHCVKVSEFEELIKKEQAMVAVMERQLSRMKNLQNFISTYQVVDGGTLEAGESEFF